MSLVNKQFYERHKKRRLEKLWRRSLAWLLAICICLGNVNVAAFAAETSGIGSMGATPSNAVKDGSTATPSNADGSASEIWLPDGTMTGEELLAEAERAVTNEFRFDFDNLMKMIDNGDSEAEDGEELSTSGQYEKLFKGYENFTLFYDNGKYGRLGGDSEEAYAYIVVRLSKEDYHSYVTGEPTHRVASASDAESGGYKMQGDEDIIFLYVNASEQDVSFYLDLEGIEASGVTVPNADAIYDEPEPKKESLPAEGSVPESAVDGIQTGGAAGGGDGKVETSPESPAPDGTEVSGENPESGESGSAGTDSGTTEGKDTAESQESSVPSSSEDSIEETAETRENASAEETTNSKETAEAVETTASTETTESAETAGLEEAAEAPETASEIQADEADKPAESEVKLSSARHHVFTLMEPAWEEEDQEFVEDDDEMTFEEWQEMMGGDDDEDEYDDSGDVIYDEEEGIIYLNMSVLPAAVAEVKKAEPKRRFFRSALFAAEEPLTKAALQASVTSADSLTPKVSGAHKQIEFKGGDSYRLHLDIAGGGAPLGIVLVIDTSGSMNDSYGYYGETRLSKLKSVLGYKVDYGGGSKGFIDNIFEKNPETKISIVTFDGYGNLELDWSGELDTIKREIGKLSADGGTNCEDGLWYANQQLKKLGEFPEGYVPCVIFLSDGVPTYYMGTEKGFEGGYKNWTRVDRHGDGSSSENTATEYAAAEFCKQNKDLKSYAINVGGSASNSVLKAITGDGKNVISADKSADLDTAFTSILDSMKLKNVKIEDTLSEYVDLPGDSLKNANVTVMAGDEELPAGKYSLSYDSSKKKVTLDLSKATTSGVLDPDTVYSLAFDIKVNEHAKSEYKTQNGYPAGVVGGQDTDYKGNDTSVGKAGFYSNTEAKATWEGNTAGFTYPKPVVQVPYEPEHRKYIKDNKNGTYDLTLDVTSKISGTSSETVYSPVDVLFVLDRTGSMDFDVNGKKAGQDGYDKDLIRKDLVNKAVKTMISGDPADPSLVGLKKYENFRYNGIQFSGSSTNISPVFGENAWKNEYKSGIALDNVTGGTYPNAAVKKAISLIGTGSKENRNNKDVKKHVILLTDGEPSDNDSQTESEIKKAIAGADKLSTQITFHVISFASKTSVYLDNLTKALNEKPNVTAIPYDANEDIATIFNAIKTSIESSIGVDTTGVKNAVITDTLSEYAEFANANITSDDVELLWNGTPMTAEQRAKAIKSVEVNSNTKTVKVTFVAGYELEKGVTYSVRFKVKPTEEANRKYAADGDYSDIGDEGTDDPAVSENERTSSGKKGFYSNETATLTYTSNDSPGEVSYQKPVLQVPQAPYEPEHWKYIKDNKDGTYDLTLDVTSKISGTSSETVYSPVDVLFVLDKTGSMAFDIYGKEPYEGNFDKTKIRKDLVNNAVKLMISGDPANPSLVGLKEYENFRYNGIQFSGSSTNILPVFGENAWEKEYKNGIALVNVTGGTYPNAAVKKAISLIDTGSKENRNNKDVKKHVILLTDGEPSDNDSQTESEIKKAIAGADKLSTQITFHVISFASKTSVYLDNLTKALNEKPNVTAIPYDANEDIATIFNAIKTSIESSIGVDTTGVKNAVITDTLSEYAEFANANITSDDVELLWNGAPMTEEQRAKAISSVEVNSDTKTVKVTFVAGYELEKGVIYSIRFKVKPTEEAYRKYAADGDYSDIGDEGTDDPAVPENERTSSGEKGFYSNDTATLTYTSNDSPGEVPYQKPVLQVTRGRFTIIKTVTGGDEGKEFIVHVKAEDGTEYSSFPLKQYQEGDILSYIYAGEKTTFTITESVPMEYKDDADNPTFVVTNHGDFVKEAKRQLEITVGPGDDIMIEVQNVFDHKTYFHGDHLVINRTTGNPERPFTNATERTENYLLEQAATPVDPGKRGIEFRELGEDDALA